MTSNNAAYSFVNSVFHPTDFSPASNIAFAHALAIALIRQASFEILNSQGLGNADWTRFPGVRDTLERWGLLEVGSPRSAVFGQFSMRVKKIAARGDPTRQTIDHVRLMRPDLVVLATHGRQGVSRWLKPSIAHKIARRSASMTLFVPAEGRGFVDPGTGHITMERILIPVDHSPDPSQSLVLATQIADALGDGAVEVRLLNVNGDAFPGDRPDHAACRYRELRASGDVTEQILAAAEDVDLVVMATEGREGFLDALRGSTTEQVVSGASCPVLAVPVMG